jgi:cell division protein FtsZ
MADAYRFSLEKGDQAPKTKIFGLGSAGCGMVETVPFPRVAVSTSPSDLERSNAERKMLISQDRLVGVYSSDKEIVKHLPSVAGHELVDVFNNTDLAFLMCGLGGASGSLGAKVFSTIARAKGVACIVLAATPFSAESSRRRDFARRMLGEIRETTLCVEFGNDDISQLAPHMPLSKAFALMNGIMTRPILDICATVSKADLSAISSLQNDASTGGFGLGLGRGNDRVHQAVHESLSSPWFDLPIEDASAGIAVYSSEDPWDKEIDEIVTTLSDKMANAEIFVGSYPDPSLKDRIRLSLLLCWMSSGESLGKGL